MVTLPCGVVINMKHSINVLFQGFPARDPLHLYGRDRDLDEEVPQHVFRRRLPQVRGVDPL